MKPFHRYLSAFSLVAIHFSSASNQEQSIETIEVLGRAQQFYLNQQTQVGTKVAADMMDIPLSAQVLTKQLITDQAARDITDLYRSIAGVSEFSYSGVTFRGFRDDDNVFYDGVRGDPFSGFSVPQVFNVERIEVLKGPAAAIYGGGEPGGMINYVTKKPSFAANRSVKLTTGTRQLAGIALDITDAINQQVAFRLGGFYEHQETFRRHTDKQNTELAGGVLYQFSDETSADLTFDYIKQQLDGHRLRGVPVYSDGSFMVDPSYNANEASDHQHLEAWVLQSQIKHDFTDDLNGRLTLRYIDNQRSQAYHESRGWIDYNQDGEKDYHDQYIRREYRDQYRANQEVSITADFVYHTEIGNMDHQWLFGTDYHDVETEFDYHRARYEAQGVPNLNVFDPEYGRADPANYQLDDLNRDGIDNQRYSFYVQDLINLHRQWIFMIGARYDYFEEVNKQANVSYDDHDISLRTGLTFKPIEDTALYANYSQSFNPVSATDVERASGPLQPTTGEQIEIGAKKAWLDGRIMTTLAIYQIDKENLVQSNPDFEDKETTPNEPELINYGLVESNGIELVLVGDLSKDISITANYAYNDTQVVIGSSKNTTNGSTFVNAPRHQAGIWVRYDLAFIDSSIALGADYVSEQFSFSQQRVKPYTVFDASWRFQHDNLLLSININNLFDKQYAVSGFNERNGHFPGEPRELMLQLDYNF